MTHITFIHGMGPQPPSGRLLSHWKGALAQDGGIDLRNENVSACMVHWADVFHGARWSLDLSLAPADELLRGYELWRGSLEDDGRRLVEALERQRPARSDEPTAELLDWDGITDSVMEVFFRDVHDYLRNVNGAQEEIRASVVQALQDAPTTTGHVVVAHSMGSVIAYDCLKRVQDCPEVGALVSFGSPLGWSAIQERLEPDYSEHDGYPGDTVREGWRNVFDPADIVVGLNGALAGDYRRGGETVIDDRPQENGGWLTARHDALAYLRGAPLRDAIREALAASGGA
jgi:hypothetical protein